MTVLPLNNVSTMSPLIDMEKEAEISVSMSTGANRSPEAAQKKGCTTFNLKCVDAQRGLMGKALLEFQSNKGDVLPPHKEMAKSLGGASTLRGSRDPSSPGDEQLEGYRFGTMEAEDYYRQVIKKKRVLGDRGLAPQIQDATRFTGSLRINMAQIFNQINNNQWLDMLLHPEEAGNEGLTREFYANLAKQHKPGYVRVHGKYVPFNGNKVAEVMGAPVFDPSKGECQYERHYLRKEDQGLFEEMVAVLCSPSAQPKVLGSVPKRSLNGLSQLWTPFVIYRLMPTAGSTHLTIERLILLYCIVQNFNINIGQLIAGEMVKGASIVQSNHALRYPSIIRALCKSAEVPKLGKNNVKVRTPLNKKTFNTIWEDWTTKENKRRREQEDERRQRGEASTSLELRMTEQEEEAVVVSDEDQPTDTARVREEKRWKRLEKWMAKNSREQAEDRRKLERAIAESRCTNRRANRFFDNYYEQQGLPNPIHLPTRSESDLESGGDRDDADS